MGLITYVKVKCIIMKEGMRGRDCKALVKLYNLKEDCDKQKVLL